MATENVQPQTTTTETVVPESTGQNTNLESNTEAKVTSAFQIPDDAQVEVIVRGEKVLKSWKDARAGIQMQEDYTRSKQAVSAKMKEVDDMYQGLTARQKAIAEKEAAIDAILGRTNTPKTKQDELADDDVLTVAQVRRMLAEHTESLKKDVSTSVSEHVTKADQEARWNRWEEQTQNTVQALVKENPLLSDIPHLDAILKREAGKDKPETEREMLAAMLKAGKELATKLEGRVQERQKEILTKKKKLTENGPVPKGGAPVFNTTKTYGKGRRVNWDEIETDALQALETYGDDD